MNLSPREREILALAGAGMRTSSIARSLNISEHTVFAYVRRASSKLGARNRTHAVAMAMRRGDLV